MKYLFIYISVIALIIILCSLVTTHQVDERTKELCKWYASLDHEKEIAPTRWQMMGDDFKKFDWFTSCINHTKYPVAK